MPTILEWIGVDAPVQCDGASLLDVLHGEDPRRGATAVHWEWDFRDPTGRLTQEMFGLGIDECSLAVLRDERGKYVHFAGLPPLFYDLDADPDELVNRADDPAYARDRARVRAAAAVVADAQRRAHADRRPGDPAGRHRGPPGGSPPGGEAGHPPGLLSAGDAGRITRL